MKIKYYDSSGRFEYIDKISDVGRTGDCVVLLEFENGKANKYLETRIGNTKIGGFECEYRSLIELAHSCEDKYESDELDAFVENYAYTAQLMSPAEQEKLAGKAVAMMEKLYKVKLSNKQYREDMESLEKDSGFNMIAKMYMTYNFIKGDKK